MAARGPLWTAARAALLALAVASLWAAPLARAENLVAQEPQVVAALLYKIAMFVDWPDNALPAPGVPIRMCVLGDDTLGEALDLLRDKELKGRPLRVENSADAGAAQGCQIVFISRSEEARLGELLPRLSERGVLLASDMPGFAEMGGVLQFYREGSKMRFKINMDASRKAGLRISSKLLRLADVVGEP